MDRYHNVLTQLKRDAPDNITIATIAILMAAKLEEPISPSFNKMIALLPIG